MSATGRGAERRADDFYETPGWCTRAIRTRLDVFPNSVVLDPCAGTGAILREFGCTRLSRAGRLAPLAPVQIVRPTPPAKGGGFTARKEVS